MGRTTPTITTLAAAVAVAVAALAAAAAATATGTLPQAPPATAPPASLWANDAAAAAAGTEAAVAAAATVRLADEVAAAHDATVTGKVDRAAAPAAAGTLDAVSRRIDGGVTKYVVRLINRERVKRGLPRVRARGVIVRDARPHSQAMASAGRLYHQSLRPLMIKWRAVGIAENVAWTTFRSPRPAKTAKRLVDNWIASPVHNRNMFDARWTHTGCAVWDTGASFWATCLYAKYP